MEGIKSKLKVERYLNLNGKHVFSEFSIIESVTGNSEKDKKDKNNEIDVNYRLNKGKKLDLL